jgi:hypothetical protein
MPRPIAARPRRVAGSYLRRTSGRSASEVNEPDIVGEAAIAAVSNRDAFNVLVYYALRTRLVMKLVRYVTID